MLTVSEISFSYGASRVITNVSLLAEAGSNIAVIGESGCGKSTLLKLIYGLLDTDSGEIKLDGTAVTGPKHNLIPGDRRMKYLAQDFGLMPFITSAENVGRYLSNIFPEQKQVRINELLTLTDMLDFASVKPVNMSGGQQQRIALAMSLALEPAVLLLDEPFSQIDAFRTNALRRNIFAYCRKRSITCIVATHDPTDVLSFADNVVVLKDGKIVTSASPKSIFSNPPDFYTASLFGDVTPAVGSQRFLYPHQISVVGNSDWKAIVSASYFKGSHFLIEAVSPSGKAYFNSREALPAGQVVYLCEIKNPE